MMPPPPAHLTDPVARRVYERVTARLVALGVWEPIDGLMVAHLAEAVAAYVDLRAMMRRLPPERACILEGALRGHHEAARQWLAEYLWIPENRVALVPLDESGDDADIAGLIAE